MGVPFSGDNEPYPVVTRSKSAQILLAQGTFYALISYAPIIILGSLGCRDKRKRG